MPITLNKPYAGLRVAALDGAPVFVPREGFCDGVVLNTPYVGLRAGAIDGVPVFVVGDQRLHQSGELILNKPYIGLRVAAIDGVPVYVVDAKNCPCTDCVPCPAATVYPFNLTATVNFAAFPLVYTVTLARTISSPATIDCSTPTSDGAKIVWKGTHHVIPGGTGSYSLITCETGETASGSSPIVSYCDVTLELRLFNYGGCIWMEWRVFVVADEITASNYYNASALGIYTSRPGGIAGRPDNLTVVSCSPLDITSSGTISCRAGPEGTSLYTNTAGTTWTVDIS